MEAADYPIEVKRAGCASDHVSVCGLVVAEVNDEVTREKLVCCWDEVWGKPSDQLEGVNERRLGQSSC